MAEAPAADMPRTENPHQTSRDMLRSSAIVAGASMITIAAGMVRIKAFALLLGPAGVGAFGLYTAFVDVAASAFGLGIASSGVRQIADAKGDDDAPRTEATVAQVRILSLCLGLLAVVTLVVGAGPLASLGFDTIAQESAVALLGLAVMFRLIGAGEAGLLQGHRRIGDLAKASIAAAVVGTLASVLLAYVLGTRGVIPALLSITAAGAAANLVYTRRLAFRWRPALSRQRRGDMLDLVTLGLAFMLSGILALGASYLVRLIVLRSGGIDAAGLYQAAWTLGGLYVGILLQAMGTDFYPRLTAIHRDAAAASSLINAQMRISILLGGPGIAATITFAPLAMIVFYSPEFTAAADTLRWICAGMALRIISWPVGFVLLARGMRRTFIATDIVAFAVQLGLALWLVPMIGLVGAGVAFLGVYLVHMPLVYAIARMACDIRVSGANLLLGCAFLGMILGLLAAFTWLGTEMAVPVGAMVTVASGLYALHTLQRLFPGSRPLAPLSRAKTLIRPNR